MFRGENCDTVPDEFRDDRDAVNFAMLFSLLQFGHGFRYELHQFCGRGASQTITLGVRALHTTGDLSTAHLRVIIQRIQFFIETGGNILQQHRVFI